MEVSTQLIEYIIKNLKKGYESENMDKSKKLIIVGAGEFGEIAYEYFTYDSIYEVVAFSEEAEFKKRSELFGLPIVDLENIEKEYAPKDYNIFTAITFTNFNRVRARIYKLCKEKGFTFATYISSKAFVWHNAHIGENVFIFENNNIQHHVEIGNNVIMWSGGSIGHRSIIGDNCFLASQVAISGYCNIGVNSFIGVNATIGDNVTLGIDSFLAAGAVTVKSLEEKGKIYIGNPAKAIEKTVYEKFEMG